VVSTFEKHLESSEVTRETFKLCVDPILRTLKREVTSDRTTYEDGGAKALGVAGLAHGP
jgi:hypothetical protein